jgi:release factor family 10
MTEKLHVKALNTLLKLEPQLGASDERTLSVYLPVRAEGFEAKHYDVLLEHLVHEYRHKLDEHQKAALDNELPRFRTHLNLARPAGCPALAAFSNEALGLLNVIRLPENVEGRIEIGPPLLTPLELMLRKYPPALVAVVDKEDGRLFASILGEVISLAEMTGQEVRHSRAGGTSAPSNQRKADNRARANLRQVAAAIDATVKRDQFTRLYVAGPQEARAALVRELPKPVASLVAGTISASLDVSPGKLLTDVRDHMLALNRASGVSAS